MRKHLFLLESLIVYKFSHLSHLHESAQQCKILIINKFLQMCRCADFFTKIIREVDDIKNRGGIMKKE